MITRPHRAAGLQPVLLSAAVLGLAAGALGHVGGQPRLGDIAWALTSAGAVAPALWSLVAGLRKGRAGVDVLAVLALAGCLAVGELFAGAVIAVMLGTGQVLEARASERARRELAALLTRAPKVVHRHDGGTITSPTLDEVRPGDLLLVMPGEVVPVDGLVERGPAVLDEATLTGEPLPVERSVGEPARSGTVNAGDAFDLRATTSAADSGYAAIIRLAEQADAATAPFVRLADRYAMAFVPVALALAGAAWAISGDAVRAVAVLVVATPCPLILAAPVAIASGLSRAARRGVVVKNGAALERLARATVLLFDKTGTLTAGRPTLSSVLTAGGTGPDELLRLAASLDQVSPHVVASSLVRAARGQGLALALPEAVSEQHGYGIRGRVDGHDVALGKASWVAGGRSPWSRTVRRRADLEGALAVFAEVDGALAGAFLLDDPVRPDSARTIRSLRRHGISRLVMVTGDRAEVAETVGAAIGVDEVLSERTPAEKVDAVRAERTGAGLTIMVGDGVNDAPALALADVGVALGQGGSTASSEAADVLLTVDRLDRLDEALVIARRSRRIALQSVVGGMGLSLVAMVWAATGGLPPALGALLQEAIDVLAILNGLRALTGHEQAVRLTPEAAAMARRFSDEHRSLRPHLDRILRAADSLEGLPAGGGCDEVRSVHRFLVEDLAPHEDAEERLLYPLLAPLLGGSDPTGAMSRGHAEIGHLIRRLGRLLDDVGPEGPDPDDAREMRRALYGLHAILRLHFDQEDEGYLSLAEAPPAGEQTDPERATSANQRALALGDRR